MSRGKLTAPHAANLFGAPGDTLPQARGCPKGRPRKVGRGEAGPTRASTTSPRPISATREAARADQPAPYTGTQPRRSLDLSPSPQASSPRGGAPLLLGAVPKVREARDKGKAAVVAPTTGRLPCPCSPNGSRGWDGAGLPYRGKYLCRLPGGERLRRDRPCPREGSPDQEQKTYHHPPSTLLPQRGRHSAGGGARPPSPGVKAWGGSKVLCREPTPSHP